MADERIRRLADETGIVERKAEQALNQADGNYDEALEVISTAPVALKGRFASSTADIYGLFRIVLTTDPPSMKNLQTVVGNNQAISNVQISLTDSEFEQAIERVARQTSLMSALSQQLEEGLHEIFSPPQARWTNYIDQADEVTLETELADEVKDFIAEEEIILSTELERVMPGASDVDSESESGEEEETEDDDRVDLLCSVEVSPLRGQPADRIRQGEPIFVDIQSGQDAHSHLIDIIEKQLLDEQMGMILARVDSISHTETGKLEITVQFGENVYGRSVVGENMNILTGQSVKKQRRSGNGSGDWWIWLLLFVALTGIALAVWYLYVTPPPA